MCDIVPPNRHFVPQVLLTAILLGFGPTLAQAQLRPEAVPGGVAEIAVAAAGAPRPEVRFGGRPVLLQQRKTGWYALVGLPLDTPVGEQKLDVGPDGDSRPQPFQVAAKDYPVQKLKIANQKMVTPDPEQIAASTPSVTARSASAASFAKCR